MASADQSCASRAIEKCGYLKIKRPPTSGKVRIKAWQSKYFVIRNVPPTFEYFKDELSYNSAHRTKDKNKINLENIIHVGTTDGSKTQRNAFMIVDTQHGAIMLATDSEQETKEWVDALRRVSGKGGADSPNVSLDHSPVLDPRQVPNNSPESGRIHSSPVGENSQGFQVTTRLTPSSEKIGIRDDYTMYITDEYVALHNMDTNALVVQWPIIGLRGWKSEVAESAGRRGTQLLTLEAGRKSDTGEGLFQFFTGHGSQIANKFRIQSELLTSAIVKRGKKGDSLEDLPHDPLGKKTKPPNKASTDPRPSTSHKMPFRKGSPLTKRAESDSLIFDKDERTNFSPTSLRPELTQEKFNKSRDESEATDDSSRLQLADNTYLDLIGDANANPVHIADSDHRRRSLDSSSLNSDEGVMMHKPLTNTANGINDCPESYIDDSEINTYKEQKSKVDKNNKELAEQNHDTTIYSDPKKMKSIEIQKPVQSTPLLCANFLDQISNPQAHQSSIFVFPEKHVSSSLQNPENVSKDTSKESVDVGRHKTTGKSSQSANEQEKEIITSQNKEIDVTNVNNQSETNSTVIGSNKESDPFQETKPFDNIDQSKSVEESKMPELMVIPKPRCASIPLSLLHGKEDTMDLLEKLVSNLESPQTPANERLFPPISKQFGHEHVEKTTPTKNEVPDEVTRRTEIAPKKTIEKSKSHCGFDSKQQTEKPPPLPVRPEMPAHARTKPSASLGDISKDMHRPLDGPKDIHRQLSPGSFGVPSGPESVVSTRILHRSTSGSSLGPVRESTVTQHSIPYTDKGTKTETYSKSRSRSMRSSGSFSPNQDNEGIAADDFDNKKRRGSKASKFMSKVLSSLNPIDSKRRASCDIIPNGGLKDVDPKRGRSASTAPGIVNEAWSPDQSIDVPSPEGSPQNFRKSQLAARRASHDPNSDRQINFISSPTFENHRTKEEMRQREKAMERERERSGLPSEPPPQLPPRKKSDPPPLPPRLRQSFGDGSNPSSPNFKLLTQEQCSISSAENQACNDDITPPPVPPRRDDRRGSHPPAIQLTTSSPEEKQIVDTQEESSTYPSSTDRASRSRHSSEDFFFKSRSLPMASSTHYMDGSVTCPIPKRPPKTQGFLTSQEALRDDDGNSARTNLKYENTETRTTTKVHGGFSNFKRTESSFVSIEMQERIHSEKNVVVMRQRTHEERLEICDIERDSIDASTTDITTTGSHPRYPFPVGSSSQRSGSVSPRTGHVSGSLSPQQSTGSAPRYSPGHTPPALSLNLSPRNGGIALGDSPTAPISA